MAPHLSHVGVHDHGFNNISTYGNLARLAREAKIQASEFERQLDELALKGSRAVLAARWSRVRGGRGYIHSFNGPHSLFADTMRSLRSLGVAHRLGHVLMGENDERISLLQRLIHHASTTAEYNVYYGEGRDAYDVRGRVAHESIFNVNDGSFRCPSTQQGYSPFTTWTRGLAWIVLGFAEQLEFLETVPDQELAPLGGRSEIEARSEIETMMRRAAAATADYYIGQAAASDGVPYWDTGAPNLKKLGDYSNARADPYNDYGPDDCNAAAATAQGLWRLGNYLAHSCQFVAWVSRFRQVALSLSKSLFGASYFSEDQSRQVLILVHIYHK